MTRRQRDQFIELNPLMPHADHPHVDPHLDHAPHVDDEIQAVGIAFSFVALWITAALVGAGFIGVYVSWLALLWWVPAAIAGALVHHRLNLRNQRTTR